ncbi:hypothetical protein HYT57_03945 [Candidatus Woesearchaeota archaeon]|nr:hypothetical protein [Candidatus Woesearchaeota archaeon]
MNALQISIQKSIITTQRIRPLRKKKIFHKTNPLVRVRQFPTFGDIKKSVEPQELESLIIKN